METLFDTPMDTIQANFEEFHNANPGVFELFHRFAMQVKNSGRTRYSADAILHRIRWHMDIDTNAADDFKINNNWSSRYARKLMKEHPTVFGGFFEVRELKTERES